MEGKVSSKYQLTIPVEVRRKLGIRPGDLVRYEVEQGKLNVTVVRPRIGEVLDRWLAEHDMSDLHEETKGDAVGFIREERGWNELDDDR